ncbi:MAG: DUF3276 family protein [Salinivirgaceae bacterium]|nr:DUF3276 family protein [Salinivirgaceae bacterium]
MEGFDKKENGRVREEIFSKSVRAGKRTYFFDVKATKRNDYYLTITESKKRYEQDGKFHYEKHKLFLYKEDFEKFAEGLTEVVEYIKKNQPEIMEKVESESSEFTNVEFEDLKEKK